MAGKGCSVFRKEIREWQVTKQQRKDILEACDRKEVDILFATQLAREGLDMQTFSSWSHGNAETW